MSDQVEAKKSRGRPSTKKEVPAGVIGAPTPTPNPNPVSNLGAVAEQDGIVISGAAQERPQEPTVETPVVDKVALLSTRNLHWSEAGVLKIGYNIVTKGASEKWLTLRGVRIATPEEVAAHFGK